MSMGIEELLTILQFTGVIVGIGFALMVVSALILTSRYRTVESSKRAEQVRLVIPTIAEERVRSALIETLDHHVEKFPEYDVYCIVDEGSTLLEELAARDDISTVVVPEEYETHAKAKGRAMHYFTETIVANEPEYWYAFIDDDNRILDRSFLYEITHYEAEGYRAMNPVLVPRPGRSLVTFMADHIRYVDDLTIYRLFTGVIGKPYLGFHGELLCARGDVLTEIGFDRNSLVEDFAFALELVKRDVPTWQSSTRVSFLSPHDVSSFLKQRSRWYLGLSRYLPKAPRLTQFIVGTRMAIWTLAITSSWLFFPLWISGYGSALPLVIFAVVLLSGMVYIVTTGIGAVRIGGLTGLALMFGVPLYAMLEHLVPIYSFINREDSFVVIDK